MRLIRVFNFLDLGEFQSSSLLRFDDSRLLGLGLGLLLGLYESAKMSSRCIDQFLLLSGKATIPLLILIEQSNELASYVVFLHVDLSGQMETAKKISLAILDVELELSNRFLITIQLGQKYVVVGSKLLHMGFKLKQITIMSGQKLVLLLKLGDLVGPKNQFSLGLDISGTKVVDDLMSSLKLGLKVITLIDGLLQDIVKSFALFLALAQLSLERNIFLFFFLSRRKKQTTNAHTLTQSQVHTNAHTCTPRTHTRKSFFKKKVEKSFADRR